MVLPVDLEPADPDDSIVVTLGACSVEILAAEIAGVMQAVELIDAPEVESVLRQIGARLVSRFSAASDR